MVYLTMKEEDEINSKKAKIGLIKYLFFDYYNQRPRLSPSTIVKNVSKEFYEKTNTEINMDDFRYFVKELKLHSSLKKPYWAILNVEELIKFSSLKPY